ncbi:MAG: RagB/SusD family nutrient uptake outer membrane protein [Sphingobacterium sp.]|jgi:hypothetical protein|nr:RagB/SusD family nutrient uptake outer membrane protein [Sphingobacterium sp.]
MKTLYIKNITRTLGTIGVLCFMVSCNDFLKEESQDEVIPKTVVDYKELLLGSGYPDDKPDPSNFTYYMDDDVEFAMDASQLGSSAAKGLLPTFSWQPSFVDRDGNGVEYAIAPASTPYARYYVWIMGCNAILDNIDKAIGIESAKDRVKAEALAVRGYLYFQLANIYGEPYNTNPESLAVPLKLHSGLEENFFKRVKVKEIYSQVLADLNEASRLMEPLDIVRGDFHINQRAIHILLSRIYLHMEDWDNCIKHANAVFEKGGRVAQLLPWATNSNNYLSYDNPEVEWVYGGATQPGQYPYIPNRGLVASFDVKDVRSTYFSKTNPDWHILSKLPTGASLKQVMRSSEALLNRAEAYAQQKKTEAAAKDLNTLRRNRITDYLDQGFTDATTLIEIIRDERRKEFCYEGFRWFDLRRYGMPAIEHRYLPAAGEDVQTYVLEKNDAMYTVPFANSLLLANPQMQQNPSGIMGERNPK